MDWGAAALKSVCRPQTLHVGTGHPEFTLREMDKVTTYTEQMILWFFTCSMFQELVTMIGETRWMLALMLILIVVDFRLGWMESKQRYEVAKVDGNKQMMMTYKWRTSRALRRTMSKSSVYLMLMLVGMAFGKALLDPVGWNHIYGAYAVAVIASFCELKSIGGHFCYINNVEIGERSLLRFIGAVVSSVVGAHSPQLGDAVKNGFDTLDEDKEDIKDK